MSVPVGERDEGRFSLEISAEFMTRYTLVITANENVFLPEYRRQVTDDIIATAKNIYLDIREANDIIVRVGTPFQRRDYFDRNRLQRQAFRECKRLLYLIDIAHRITIMFYIRKSAEASSMITWPVRKEKVLIWLEKG